jgi:tripartite-type tricarboxylate transporter receptor subunit TctC
MYAAQRLCVASAIAWAAAVAFTPAQAQQYPEQDIHFVCAFPPGSGADVLVRYFAEKVRPLTGKNIVVENRSGAIGKLALEYTTRAKPDGYTIFVHGGSAVASFMSLFKDPPADVSKTIQVVATINRQPFMVVVDAKSPYKSLDDLTKAMLAKGDKASYASVASNGTVMGELYKARTGIKATEVVYKNAADSLNDQLSGAVDYGMHDPVYSLAQQREGRLRILGVSTGTRLEAMPDLPTMKEQGVDMDLVGWWAAMVPIATPRPIQEQIHKWFVQVVSSQETKEFLNKFGGDPFISTPEKAQELFIQDIENWRSYVKTAKIMPQG